MAGRALASASSLLLLTALAAPASAEERGPVPGGPLAVPGPGGTVVLALIAAFHRPPAPLASRLEGWSAPPPGLPRATIATVWRVTF